MRVKRNSEATDETQLIASILENSLTFLDRQEKDIRERLTHLAKQVESKQAASQERQKRLEELISEKDELIKLDVGGSIFEIRASTITRDRESMLYALLFNERFQVQKENGCVKINRDPKHFRHILNFLLNPEEYVPPSSPEEREEILRVSLIHFIR